MGRRGVFLSVCARVCVYVRRYVVRVRDCTTMVAMMVVDENKNSRLSSGQKLKVKLVRGQHVAKNRGDSWNDDTTVAC